jgi:Ca2+-binding RTX toxin-like protein
LAFTTTVGAGGTSLIGTSGVDTTTFAPGTLATAVFIGAQADSDFITLQNNQANNYTIRGGAGVDTINAAGFLNSIVTGDDGNDSITITGTIQSSTVSGLEGNDTIAVQSVNGSVVNGNNGNDIMSSAGGATFTNNGKLVGGQGNDTITLGINANAAGRVTLTSGLVNGQDGDDTITISNVAAMSTATVFGGQGSDIISAATNGFSVIISGDLGADNLTGSAVGDTIFGGDGNDRITGGAGGDRMSGGSEVDTYVQGGAATAATGVSAAGVVNGTTYTFFAGGAVTVDVITDFAFGLNGDIISGMGGGSTAPTNFNQQTAAQQAANAAGTVYSVSGNFNTTTGVFTAVANNSGSDTLLVTTNAIGQTADAAVQTSFNNLILQNVNLTTLTASNFS